MTSERLDAALRRRSRKDAEHRPHQKCEVDPRLSVPSPLAGLALLAFALAPVAEGSGPHSSLSHRTRATVGSEPARSLKLVTAPTPRFAVPHYVTSGTFPQVTGSGVSLRAVNSGLRESVLADQRHYAPYARRQRAGNPSAPDGVYRTRVDRKLASASTVVVSALLPLTREAFPGQHGGDGWLSITRHVPSGAPVTVTKLFANPNQGIRVLAMTWKALIRNTGGAFCLRTYPEHYTATIAHYQEFALTPGGVAVGSWELEACYRLVATVPYRVLRPYLSRLGLSLVAGVRPAR